MEKFFFISNPSLRLGLPLWGEIRNSICRAPGLKSKDWILVDILKGFNVPSILDHLDEQILFKFSLSPLNPAEMTLEEHDHLTKGLKSLKKKDGLTGDLPKKARIGEFSHAIPIQAMPAPEPATIILSPTPSKEVAPSAPLQLEEATKKKKKRAVGKKVERRVRSSKSGGPDQEQASLDDRENALDDIGHGFPLPIDADPLSNGILIKPLIRSLKKEIHHLKMKLRKIEDDLQELRKNASEETVEVTHLRNLQRKDSTSFSIWKGNFESEMVKLGRSASNKSWELTAKISSLEIDITMEKKKI
ncbi:hypothetical protein COCNU_scaffold000782G000010 [Cocos nucifera]|nr:hypothetical protein [Cocos nucifera]